MMRQLLVERLTGLVADGLLEKLPYQERSLRYEYRLTQKGRDLCQVILALIYRGTPIMPVMPDRPPFTGITPVGMYSAQC